MLFFIMDVSLTFDATIKGFTPRLLPQAWL